MLVRGSLLPLGPKLRRRLCGTTLRIPVDGVSLCRLVEGCDLLHSEGALCALAEVFVDDEVQEACELFSQIKVPERHAQVFGRPPCSHFLFWCELLTSVRARQVVEALRQRVIYGCEHRGCADCGLCHWRHTEGGHLRHCDFDTLSPGDSTRGSRRLPSRSSKNFWKRCIVKSSRFRALRDGWSCSHNDQTNGAQTIHCSMDVFVKVAKEVEELASGSTTAWCPTQRLLLRTRCAEQCCGTCARSAMVELTRSHQRNIRDKMRLPVGVERVSAASGSTPGGDFVSPPHLERTAPRAARSSVTLVWRRPVLPTLCRDRKGQAYDSNQQMCVPPSHLVRTRHQRPTGKWYVDCEGAVRSYK